MYWRLAADQHWPTLATAAVDDERLQCSTVAAVAAAPEEVALVAVTEVPMTLVKPTIPVAGTRAVHGVHSLTGHGTHRPRAA